MKEINRREVLKGLGVVSAASLASQVACDNRQPPAQPPSAASKTAVTPGTLLNIVLHGTYAIILEHGKNGKSLTLKAPVVSDHVYYAATADLDSSKEVIWRQMNWIFQNSSFGINIQGSSTSMAIPDPKNLQTDRVIIDWDLSNINGYNKNKPAYHSLSLAWPDSIYPLRADHNNKLKGQTLIDNNVTPTQLPTVYVLAYQFATPSTPTFKDNFGVDRPILPGSDGVMRLHLFAEPKDHGDCDDPNMALKALRQMFTVSKGKLDLSLEVVDDAVVPPDVANLPPGVDHCEERSTGELTTPCSMFADFVKTVTVCSKSGHPRNCMAVMINRQIA